MSSATINEVRKSLNYGHDMRVQLPASLPVEWSCSKPVALMHVFFDVPDITSTNVKRYIRTAKSLERQHVHPGKPNSPFRIPFRVLSFSQAKLPLTAKFHF